MDAINFFRSRSYTCRLHQQGFALKIPPTWSTKFRREMVEIVFGELEEIGFTQEEYRFDEIAMEIIVKDNPELKVVRRDE